VKEGRFIALEGIDGAGTTSLATAMLKWLAGRGVQSAITREPSDGPIGTLIRQVLRGRIRMPEAAGSGSIPMETIALLFAADRIDHIQAEVVPALRKGVWVLSDRYVDSSKAYQGTVLDPAWVADINRHAMKPDLTLFLRVDVDVALSRISTTRLQKDIFETKEMLVKVAAIYDSLYSRQTPDVAVLDSNRTLQEVEQAMEEALVRAFPGL